MFEEALAGDGNGWAKFTSDPMVNCSIDCYLLGEKNGAVQWEDLREWERDVYRQEALDSFTRD